MLGLTDPEISLQISEALFVLSPVAVEAQIAFFSSLNHLDRTQVSE